MRLLVIGLRYFFLESEDFNFSFKGFVVVVSWDCEIFLILIVLKVI